MAPMGRLRCAALAAGCCLTWLDAGVAAQAPADAVVRAIRVSQDAGRTTVVVEADTALPDPTFGSLTDPPRIYLDFSGATPKVRATTSGTGAVKAVRVALNASNPNVTRVVLDLTDSEPYQVDAGQRLNGLVSIVVGAAASSAAARPTRPAPAPPAPDTPPPTPPPALPRSTTSTPAPAPSLAAPSVAASAPAPVNATPEAPGISKPSPPAPVVSGAPPVPVSAAATAGVPSREPRRRPLFVPPPSARTPAANDVDQYRKRHADLIAKLQAAQPLVMSIDAGEAVSVARLQAAMNELTVLRGSFDSAKPSPALSFTHELLLTSCTLGASAARLSLEAARDSNDQARQSAASAAAGELMLFDWACAVLGCSRPSP